MRGRICGNRKELGIKKRCGTREGKQKEEREHARKVKERREWREMGEERRSKRKA